MSQSAASHLSPAFPRRAAWGTAGALRAWQAEALKLYLQSGRTDFLAVATPGAGKTTLLNCLAAAIPGRERIISCEEVFELRLPAPDWVAMQTRSPNLEGTGEVPLRRLIKEALRMRPDRLLG